METHKKKFPSMRSSSSSSFFPNPDPDPFSNPETRWKYDVFINFRGEDTRRNFVPHLHSALSKAGVNTFLDEENLDKGMQLQELMEAIEGSQIAIVVFSKRYANSSWCLDELMKIIECHEKCGQRVVPVFYYVDPSVVRHQKGDFGNSLAAAAARKTSRTRSQRINILNKWKTALSYAASLAGWNVINYRNEAELVKEIVKDILTKLDYDALFITEFPVGLVSRGQEVIRLIENRPTEVSIIGIWGMGGSGKTTLAKALYNQIHRRCRFIDKSFIEDIREVCEADKRGHVHLQQQLLSDVLKRRVEIRSIGMGKTLIKNRLSGKKVLIVLDDVNEFGQLEDLCGNREWFGQGTIIIVTTRDLRLLNQLKVDLVYKMEEMNTNESLELFSWHAFGDAKPIEGFDELARNVVAYCGGLPLALRVLGSYLNDRDKKMWEDVLSKLEIIPADQVQEKLRISFDGLGDHMLKDIFLDVCCFFIGKDRAYVTDVLNGCGLHADIGVTVLIERSLIKIEKNNKLGMHHLLRDMGREIIRESSTMEPGKRSRLWCQEDVLHVLTKNTGTEAIEGLALTQNPNSSDYFTAYAFKEMKRLRLLQLDDAQLTGDYGYLSKNLRWICWQGFPFKYMPDNFDLKGVIAIDLIRSNLRLVWKKTKVLQWLKILNLSHSKYLIETPDFSKLPSLEKLILEDCPSLSKVHQSIGDLRNLLLINLKDCTRLKNLPRETYKLKSVKTLILSGCLNIDILEKDIVQMESLTTLIAENITVKQVPFSIVSSRNIGYISLCGYKGQSHDVFSSFIRSWMSPAINPLSCSFSVTSSSPVFMDMQNNYLCDLAPMLSDLSNLRSVLVQCDPHLLLYNHLETFMDDVCGLNFTRRKTRSDTLKLEKKTYLIRVGSYKEVFNTLSGTISEGLSSSESCDDFLPGDNFPYWLAHKGEGHAVCFTVPKDCRMKGMALCVVYLSTLEIMGTECVTCVLIVNYTKCTIQILKRDTVISLKDGDWQGIISHFGPGDKVEVFVTFRHELVAEKTAVYLMCDESIDKEIETSPEPKKNAFVEFPKNILILALGLFLFLSFLYLATKRSILYSSVLPRREEL